MISRLKQETEQFIKTKWIRLKMKPRCESRRLYTVFRQVNKYLELYHALPNCLLF